MGPEYLQDLRRSVMAELAEIKTSILAKMRQSLEESFGPIPIEVRRLPLLCLIEGLERNYNGKSIMVRKGKGTAATGSSGGNKRPSVMLQVEDQSFVFDGDGLRVIGDWNGGEYKGMVDEINNVLKKHMTK